MQSFVATLPYQNQEAKKQDKVYSAEERTNPYIHEHLQYRMTLFAQTKIESFLKISMGGKRGKFPRFPKKSATAYRISEKKGKEGHLNCLWKRPYVMVL